MATSHAYTSRNPDDLSDAEILAEAHGLVETFLALLRRERVDSDILDARLLPASRASFENAFRLVIATEARAAIRKRLMSAGMTLAQFQSDVGKRMSIRPAQPSQERASAGQSSGKAQWVDIPLTHMIADTQRLRTLFLSAEAIAERRFPHPSPPFREDGTYTWHGHH